MEAGPTHDSDIAVAVGAHHSGPGHSQGVDHVLAGMTVPVVRPDADDRDPWPYRGEEFI